MMRGKRRRTYKNTEERTKDGATDRPCGKHVRQADSDDVFTMIATEVTDGRPP